MTVQTTGSLLDFYKDPASPYAGFSQVYRSVGSTSLVLCRAEQKAHQIVDPPGSEMMLTVALKCDMLFRQDIGDGWTPEIRARTGIILLGPPQTEISYDCRDAHQVLNLILPGKAVETLLDEHRAGKVSSFDSLAGATFFRDEGIRRTAIQLWIESARPGGTSDLLIDGLTQVLLARLLDKANAMRRPRVALPLGQGQLARIDSLVDAQLADRITVETLARAVDMPRWNFAEAFKAKTGETPHAYVTTKCIHKACDYLRLGDMPLAEIAYATGFSSQSHMTDTFRRLLGITPGAWRKEVRG